MFVIDAEHDVEPSTARDEGRPLSSLQLAPRGVAAVDFWYAMLTFESHAYTWTSFSTKILLGALT